jgi:hypothetical protein
MPVNNQTMLARTHPIRIASLALLALSAPLPAQVHYQPNGSPWTQRASSGSDAEVPVWFYYQPNRDNAGDGPDARMTATAAAAFIFTIPKHSLLLTGKPSPVTKP